MTPDRMVVGEVRGGEALALLDVWSTGHGGGCATVHSNLAKDALLRLENMTARVSQNPQQATIGYAVNLIVYLKHLGNNRIVEHIIEVNGYNVATQAYNLKSNVKNFLKDNCWTPARMGLAVAAVVIMPDSVSYAQSGTTDDTISVITQPLSRMENLMAGPVPKAIVTIGAATGAASWALNIENQVTKTAMRVVGGGNIRKPNDRIFNSVRLKNGK